MTIDMVYFDGIHLVADSIKELHEFARKCGMNIQWYQNHPAHPHYDVWGWCRQVVRRKADKGEVKIISSKELLTIAQKMKQNG